MRLCSVVTISIKHLCFFQVVYVTPERMFPGDGSQPDPTFMAMASERKLGLIAIDEAHCIFSSSVLGTCMQGQISMY